jgi:hypothetical protein
MSSSTAIRNLAAIRLAVGLVSWLAPNLGGRLFGLDPAGNPQAPYLARLFGVRDVVLAVGAVQSTGAAQRQWLQLGVACDVADTAAAALGRRGGYLPPLTAALVGGTALAATALGVQALQAPAEPGA